MSQKVNNLEFAANKDIFFERRYIKAMQPCISEPPPMTCISEPSLNINVNIFCIKTEENSSKRTISEKYVSLWADHYKTLINDLNSNLEKIKQESFLSDFLHQYKLEEFTDIVKFITDETEDKVIFYSLVNILSKYPYIKNINGNKSYSISPQGFINLSIVKKRNSFSSILNLEFRPDGKITFNTHDDEVNDFLLHGTFVSPKKYLSNRKFKLLLRLVDD